MDQRKILGNRGEAAAKKYLIANGYRIIANNYKIGHLELDLIAKLHNRLIFVEVKTRLKSTTEANDIFLGTRQINNLKKAIIGYAHKNRANLDAVQLDLIVILADLETNSARLKHYQNIF